MIDICTVVFESELPILKLQAQSVGQFCRSLGVRNIYVVLNDIETLAEKIDPGWWGPMANSVLVVPRTAFSAPWVDNGWVSQQALKLLTASMSYNQFTMVLDAKTIFVRPVTLADVFNDQGRLSVGQMAVFDVFKPAKNIVDQLFGIDLQHQAGPGGVPFFLHNDTVRFMITDVTLRTREPFPTWFQNQGMLTEFMLYSGYCQWKYGSLDVFYENTNSFGQIVNLCHNEVALFEHKMSQMHNANTVTVSIHRNAWSALSQEQRTQYRMYLIDRGIIAAWELA
jgi:hypothetical protein